MARDSRSGERAEAHGVGMTALLRLLILAALFVGSGLYYSLLWYPVTLAPFWTVFRSSLPLAWLLLLAPLIDLLLRPRIGRVLRLPASIPGALILGGVLAIILISAQIILIEQKPYLTLIQYLREELWILWLLALPLGLGVGMVRRTWGRRAPRAAGLAKPDDAG